MRSLKREAGNLAQQMDSWPESDMIRSRKSKHHQIFRKKNRDQMVDTSEDDSEMESESIEKRRNISEEIGNGGQESSENLTDEDYRVFLEYVGVFLKGDHMEGRAGEENLGTVLENLADCSPNEVVVAENVESNEAILAVDCTDPHYKIFLDNVREDGEFYVFEKEREDGTIETIQYEREDEDLGEFMDVEVAEPVAVAVAMNFVENVEELERRGDCVEEDRLKDNSVQERNEDFSVTMKVKDESLDGDLIE